MKQVSRLMLGGLALATAIGAPAFASGSMGGSTNATAQFGQSVYMRKVACKKCAFPGGIRDADQATMALAKIASGEIAMSDREKRAVTDFINRRFRRG